MSAIKNNEGIDIQKALAILSARKTDPSDSDDGCGCHGTRAPDDAKNLGQEIDLFGERSSRNAQEEQKVDEEKTQKERAKRKEDILNELKGMSLAELLRTLLKAQEDRVKAYNEFENGLVTVLQTGNISKYPEATLKATVRTLEQKLMGCGNAPLPYFSPFTSRRRVVGIFLSPETRKGEVTLDSSASSGTNTATKRKPAAESRR
eukprot:scaffold2816_cov121-Cylindrotheca_fusiformis.AAC.12